MPISSTRPNTTPNVTPKVTSTTTPAATTPVSASPTSPSTPASPATSTAEVRRQVVSEATQTATRQTAVAAEQATQEAFQRSATGSMMLPQRGIADAPQTAATSSLLKVGSNGQPVQDAQNLLNQTGANLGADGIYGPKTKAAVKTFQREHGLPSDGIIGPNTQMALQRAALEPPKSLRWGAQGAAVTDVQNKLNSVGYNLHVDGEVGNATYSAVRDFQSRAGLPIDGVVGAQTRGALDEVIAGTRRLGPPTTARQSARRTSVSAVSAASHTDVPNNVAQFDTLTKAGRRNQMAQGRITVNGNTYDFRSGGGGKGNLPPGDYSVTRHRDQRSDKPSMMVDGVGYSFALSNKYDPRVNATRKLLRIHPDGGGPGTIGCIGVVGNGAVQRQFRQDMLAEIARNGGSYTLQVRE